MYPNDVSDLTTRVTCLSDVPAATVLLPIPVMLSPIPMMLQDVAPYPNGVATSPYGVVTYPFPPPAAANLLGPLPSLNYLPGNRLLLPQVMYMTWRGERCGGGKMGGGDGEGREEGGGGLWGGSARTGLHSW